MPLLNRHPPIGGGSFDGLVPTTVTPPTTPSAGSVRIGATTELDAATMLMLRSEAHPPVDLVAGVVPTMPGVWGGGFVHQDGATDPEAVFPWGHFENAYADVNHYYQYATPAGLDWTGNWTVDFTARTTEDKAVNDASCLFCVGDPSEPTTRFEVILSHDESRFIVRHLTLDVLDFSQSFPADAAVGYQWQLFAIEKSGTTLRAYRDGALVGTMTYSLTIPTPTHVRFLQSFPGYQRWQRGYHLADIRISNVARYGGVGYAVPRYGWGTPVLAYVTPDGRTFRVPLPDAEEQIVTSTFSLRMRALESKNDVACVVSTELSPGDPDNAGIRSATADPGQPLSRRQVIGIAPTALSFGEDINVITSGILRLPSWRVLQKNPGSGDTFPGKLIPGAEYWLADPPWDTGFLTNERPRGAGPQVRVLTALSEYVGLVDIDTELHGWDGSLSGTHDNSTPGVADIATAYAAVPDWCQVDIELEYTIRRANVEQTGAFVTHMYRFSKNGTTGTINAIGDAGLVATLGTPPLIYAGVHGTNTGDIAIKIDGTLASADTWAYQVRWRIAFHQEGVAP